LEASEAAVEELFDYQNGMRAVWLSPGDGHRRYWAFKLRAKFYEALEQQARARVPKTVKRIRRGKWERILPWKVEYGDFARDLEFTPFEQALNRLDDLGQRTRVCGNRECPAPFFIAGRRSQKYCSEKCAGVFQQQAKRAWWREHGNAWREARQKRDQRSGKL
jgi:hypothetical protein